MATDAEPDQPNADSPIAAEEPTPEPLEVEQGGLWLRRYTELLLDSRLERFDGYPYKFFVGRVGNFSIQLDGIDWIANGGVRLILSLRFDHGMSKQIIVQIGRGNDGRVMAFYPRIFHGPDADIVSAAVDALKLEIDSWLNTVELQQDADASFSDDEDTTRVYETLTELPESTSDGQKVREAKQADAIRAGLSGSPEAAARASEGDSQDTHRYAASASDVESSDEPARTQLDSDQNGAPAHRSGFESPRSDFHPPAPLTAEPDSDHRVTPPLLGIRHQRQGVEMGPTGTTVDPKRSRQRRLEEPGSGPWYGPNTNGARFEEDGSDSQAAGSSGAIAEVRARVLDALKAIADAFPGVKFQVERGGSDLPDGLFDPDEEKRSRVLGLVRDLMPLSAHMSERPTLFGRLSEAVADYHRFPLETILADRSPTTEKTIGAEVATTPDPAPSPGLPEGSAGPSSSTVGPVPDTESESDPRDAVVHQAMIESEFARRRLTDPGDANPPVPSVEAALESPDPFAGETPDVLEQEPGESDAGKRGWLRRGVLKFAAGVAGAAAVAGVAEVTIDDDVPSDADVPEVDVEEAITRMLGPDVYALVDKSPFLVSKLKIALQAGWTFAYGGEGSAYWVYFGTKLIAFGVDIEEDPTAVTAWLARAIGRFTDDTVDTSVEPPTDTDTRGEWVDRHMRKSLESWAAGELVAIRARREILRGGEEDIGSADPFLEATYERLRIGALSPEEARTRIAKWILADPDGSLYQEHFNHITEMWFEYRGVVTGLGFDVDELVSYSPSLVEVVKTLKSHGWTFRYVSLENGQFGVVDPETKEILVRASLEGNATEILYVLAQQAVVASHTPEEAEPEPSDPSDPVPGMTEQEWIEREIPDRLAPVGEQLLMSGLAWLEVSDTGREIDYYTQEHLGSTAEDFGERDLVEAARNGAISWDEAWAGIVANLVADTTSGPYRAAAQDLRFIWARKYAGKSEGPGGNSVAESNRDVSPGGRLGPRDVGVPIAALAAGFDEDGSSTVDETHSADGDIGVPSTGALESDAAVAAVGAGGVKSADQGADTNEQQVLRAKLNDLLLLPDAVHSVMRFVSAAAEGDDGRIGIKLQDLTPMKRSDSAVPQLEITIQHGDVVRTVMYIGRGWFSVDWSSWLGTQAWRNGPVQDWNALTEAQREAETAAAQRRLVADWEALTGDWGNEAEVAAAFGRLGALIQAGLPARVHVGWTDGHRQLTVSNTGERNRVDTTAGEESALPPRFEYQYSMQSSSKGVASTVFWTHGRTRPDVRQLREWLGELLPGGKDNPDVHAAAALLAELAPALGDAAKARAGRLRELAEVLVELASAPASRGVLEKRANDLAVSVDPLQQQPDELRARARALDQLADVLVVGGARTWAKLAMGPSEDPSLYINASVADVPGIVASDVDALQEHSDVRALLNRADVFFSANVGRSALSYTFEFAIDGFFADTSRGLAHGRREHGSRFAGALLAEVVGDLRAWFRANGIDDGIGQVLAEVTYHAMRSGDGRVRAGLMSDGGLCVDIDGPDGEVGVIVDRDERGRHRWSVTGDVRMVSGHIAAETWHQWTVTTAQEGEVTDAEGYWDPPGAGSAIRVRATKINGLRVLAASGPVGASESDLARGVLDAVHAQSELGAVLAEGPWVPVEFQLTLGDGSTKARRGAVRSVGGRVWVWTPDGARHSFDAVLRLGDPGWSDADAASGAAMPDGVQASQWGPHRVGAGQGRSAGSFGSEPYARHSNSGDSPEPGEGEARLVSGGEPLYEVSVRGNQFNELLYQLRTELQELLGGRFAADAVDLIFEPIQKFGGYVVVRALGSSGGRRVEIDLDGHPGRITVDVTADAVRVSWEGYPNDPQWRDTAAEQWARLASHGRRGDPRPAVPPLSAERLRQLLFRRPRSAALIELQGQVRLELDLDPNSSDDTTVTWAPSTGLEQDGPWAREFGYVRDLDGPLAKPGGHVPADEFQVFCGWAAGAPPQAGTTTRVPVSIVDGATVVVTDQGQVVPVAEVAQSAGEHLSLSVDSREILDAVARDLDGVDSVRIESADPEVLAAAAELTDAGYLPEGQRVLWVDVRVPADSDVLDRDAMFDAFDRLNAFLRRGIGSAVLVLAGGEPIDTLFNEDPLFRSYIGADSVQVFLDISGADAGDVRRAIRLGATGVLTGDPESTRRRLAEERGAWPVVLIDGQPHRVLSAEQLSNIAESVRRSAAYQLRGDNATDGTEVARQVNAMRAPFRSLVALKSETGEYIPVPEGAWLVTDSSNIRVAEEAAFHQTHELVVEEDVDEVSAWMDSAVDAGGFAAVVSGGEATIQSAGSERRYGERPLQVDAELARWLSGRVPPRSRTWCWERISRPSMSEICACGSDCWTMARSRWRLPTRTAPA